MVGACRRVSVLFRRRTTGFRRYIKGCQDSLAPMPNPEWYQEDPPMKPLYKVTPKEHVEVWKGTWAAYKASFRGEDAPDVEAERKRQAEEKAKAEGGLVEGVDDELANMPEGVKQLMSKKEEFENEMKEVLSEMKVELTPEEQQKYRQELARELTSEDGSLRQFIKEKLELLREAIRAFLQGYREGREGGATEVEEALKKQMGTLKTMLTEQDWSPEALEEAKQRQIASLKEAVKSQLFTTEERQAIDEEAARIMEGYDKASNSQEVRQRQQELEALMNRVKGGAVVAFEAAKGAAAKGAKVAVESVQAEVARVEKEQEDKRREAETGGKKSGS